jgi:hypothetical protein
MIQIEVRWRFAELILILLKFDLPIDTITSAKLLSLWPLTLMMTTMAFIIAWETGSNI